MEYTYCEDGTVLMQLSAREAQAFFTLFDKEHPVHSHLSAPDREARITEAVLLRAEGRKLYEIADVLGVTQSTISTWLKTARNQDNLRIQREQDRDRDQARVAEHARDQENESKRRGVTS